MTTTGSDRVALAAGAGGIIGHAVAHELKRQSWTVRALGRRAVGGLPTILADLTDSEATAAALRHAADTTHLFYAALSPDPDLAVEAERNGRMLGNLLDGLEAAGAPLRRVVIYQGFKIYGIHLGAKVRTPARESDPPHMPPNIYLAQEAQLKARAERSRWDYVALRPDVVVGDIHGNPMNIALVVGAFAELSRALGIPMRFPGTDKAYGQIVQFTDAGLLARRAPGRRRARRRPARLSMSPMATSSAGSGCGRTRPDISAWAPPRRSRSRSPATWRTRDRSGAKSPPDTA
jgi:nucleoside-diphosphate-sugar epimerase